MATGYTLQAVPVTVQPGVAYPLSDFFTVEPTTDITGSGSIDITQPDWSFVGMIGGFVPPADNLGLAGGYTFGGVTPGKIQYFTYDGSAPGNPELNPVSLGDITVTFSSSYLQDHPHFSLASILEPDFGIQDQFFNSKYINPAFPISGYENSSEVPIDWDGAVVAAAGAPPTSSPPTTTTTTPTPPTETTPPTTTTPPQPPQLGPVGQAFASNALGALISASTGELSQSPYFVSQATATTATAVSRGLSVVNAFVDLATTGADLGKVSAELSQGTFNEADATMLARDVAKSSADVVGLLGGGVGAKFAGTLVEAGIAVGNALGTGVISAVGAANTYGAFIAAGDSPADALAATFQSIRTGSF